VKNLHLLLAFDSFKGCLPSRKVGEHFAKGWASQRPDDEFTLLPLADGGEGTLEAFASLGGEMVKSLQTIAASGLHEVAHLELHPGEVVMEVAQTLGIEDVGPESPPAMVRSSSHFGQQFLRLHEAGARHFMIGLGGSCTTDGGLGLLQELGLKGLGAHGEVLPLLPGNLAEVVQLEWEPKLSFDEIKIEILGDVTNPLFGRHGAFVIFGPQKGLSPSEINFLDKEVARIYDLLEPLMETKVRDKAGAGAAGGIGAALLALGGTCRPGAEVLFDALELDDLLERVDLIFTGEGRSDDQTVQGKGPFRLAKRGAKKGKRTVLVSGSYDPNAHGVLLNSFAGVHSVISGVMTLEEAMDLGWVHLEQMGANLASIFSEQIQ
jgi:glycerate 2-kinase